MLIKQLEQVLLYFKVVTYTKLLKFNNGAHECSLLSHYRHGTMSVAVKLWTKGFVYTSFFG